MYSPMKNLKEFHKTFAPGQSHDNLSKKIDRRFRLIREEFDEVKESLIHYENTFFNETSSTIAEAKVELAKELADLLYVIYGTAEELDIPLEEVFLAVHESNMQKIWPDGTVHYNAFGKVMKPDTYSKPDLSFIHEH